jgi:hypothetical protein
LNLIRSVMTLPSGLDDASMGGFPSREW